MSERVTSLCATSRACFGLCTCCNCPVVVFAKAFTTSVTEIVAIFFICMTERRLVNILCMCSVVFTNKCSNASFFTGRICCYSTFVPLMSISINRNFSSGGVTAVTSKSLFTNCRAGRLKCYNAVVIFVITESVNSPSTGSLYFSTSCSFNCIAIISAVSNSEIVCLIPLVSPIVGGIRSHANENNVSVSGRNNCCVNALLARGNHAYPVIAAVVPHINCETCIVAIPKLSSNEINGNFSCKLSNGSCFILVTAGSCTVASFFAFCIIGRSESFVPITPCVAERIDWLLFNYVVTALFVSTLLTVGKTGLGTSSRIAGNCGGVSVQASNITLEVTYVTVSILLAIVCMRYNGNYLLSNDNLVTNRTLCACCKTGFFTCGSHSGNGYGSVRKLCNLFLRIKDLAAGVTVCALCKTGGITGRIYLSVTSNRVVVTFKGSIGFTASCTNSKLCTSSSTSGTIM